jgi:hypothetical protein
VKPEAGRRDRRRDQSPDFTLDWDPEPNLTTEGQALQPAAVRRRPDGGGAALGVAAAFPIPDDQTVGAA